MRPGLVLLLIVVSGLSACESGPALVPDAGPTDGGARVDAGTPVDAGDRIDAGDPVDAGDAGNPVDAGEPTDAGADAGFPWVHVRLPAGGYDFPLRTFWNGTGWDALGVVPDPRSENPAAGAITVSYDCAAWEVTTHGRRLYPGGTPATPYARADLDSFVAWWSALAGVPLEVFNDLSSFATDGGSSAIQLLPAFAVGDPTPLSPHPACDGPAHDRGQGLFALAVPPGFDARRARKYPVVFVNPGTTTSLQEQFFIPEAWRAVEGSSPELWPKLLGQSVRGGGEGVLILFGSAGGQGSQGTNGEYAKAVNAAMQLLAERANADLGRVVTVGISRGGSNALIHASRAGRNYTAVGAFAEVPATRYSHLVTLPLPLMPNHGAYTTLTCATDPDCANGWRWDHSPAPGSAPYELFRPWFNEVDLTRVDARGPWGLRNGFDTGAWVELCTGDRDHAAGGVAQEYLAGLPSRVQGRLNYVFGSAHRGNLYFCERHLEEFVLDRLVGNANFTATFQRVDAGTFYYRIPLNDQGPSAGTRASDYTPMTANGCGSPPPVLVVPLWQEYRADAGVTEPAGFLLTGDLSRRWRVDLTLAVSSATPVLSWQGGGGAALPAGCEPYPVAGSTTGVVCRYAGGIDACTGGSSVGCGASSETCRALCGWRLAFDCNGDGTAEAIDPQRTPFQNWALVGILPDDAGTQSYAYLVVGKKQCFSMGGNALLNLPACIPTVAFSPWIGFPQTLSPCLNPGSTACAP
jgi:hypothetical protein